MNRRSAIKRFAIITAGIAWIPSCMSPSGEKADDHGQIPVTDEQQRLLAAIANVIIPSEVNSPGAREVSASVFALAMLNDCYQESDRERFIKGLKQFNDGVVKHYGHSFLDCNASQQESMIASANGQPRALNDAAFFYHSFKQLILEGYTSSQYFLTNIHPYKLVPGPFKSHVVVKQA
jgi:hypothetical protein